MLVLNSNVKIVHSSVKWVRGEADQKMIEEIETIKVKYETSRRFLISRQRNLPGRHYVRTRRTYTTGESFRLSLIVFSFQS